MQVDRAVPRERVARGQRGEQPEVPVAPLHGGFGVDGAAARIPAVDRRLVRHAAWIDGTWSVAGPGGPGAGGVHGRLRVDQPAHVGLVPAGQLVALWRLRALLEAHPIARAVLHL